MLLAFCVTSHGAESVPLQVAFMPHTLGLECSVLCLDSRLACFLHVVWATSC